MQNVRHIVVIMNGTARWAAETGRSLLDAQRASLDAARSLAAAAASAKVRYLTLCGDCAELPGYPQTPVVPAAPTLPPRSVSASVGAADLRPTDGAQDLHSERIAALVGEIQSPGSELAVTLRLGESARRDIAAAVRKLAVAVQAGRLDPQQIDESLLRAALSTATLPDPDLILYTGCRPGEHRLRDDLIFESAYAEFLFSERLWPDFTSGDFLLSLSDFAGRQRRFGKTGEQVSSNEPGAGRYCVASSSIGS